MFSKHLHVRSLQHQIKFQKELMRCVSEVRGRMQIKLWVSAASWQEFLCQLLHKVFDAVLEEEANTDWGRSTGGNQLKVCRLLSGNNTKRVFFYTVKK